MEAFEGVVVGGNLPLNNHENNDETKLQRPSSPIVFTIASPHLSRGEVGEYNTNEAEENNNDDNKEENVTLENNIKNINAEEENIAAKDNNNKVNSNDNDDNNDNNQTNSTNLKLTPANSFNGVNSTIAEEEHAARLLILLSQGNSRESSTVNYYLDRNYSPPSTKFSSKKYIETSSNVDQKSGVFVYECKTCNRTFPSFQALGGHRASHKKPKNLAIDELKKRNFSSVFSDDYDYDFDPSSSSSFSRNNNNSIMRKTATSRRTHECSYCGAEFTSGQALGGHMRRHRGSNCNNNSNYHYNHNNDDNINNTQPLLALSPSLMSSLSVTQDSLENKKQKISNDNKDALSLSLSLSLDLNLPSPPPADNDQKNQDSTNTEFMAEKISSPPPEKQHEQKQEQTGNKESELLISTKPTLVDCQH